MCDHDIELRRKRDLERYHRRTAERRAKGLCLKCGKRPPAPHRTQCEPCIEKRRPADLVGRLEELGIGRPSTYAAIVAVLRERGYAVLYRRRFVATERGRVVTAFLERYFAKWVAYGFTKACSQSLPRYVIENQDLSDSGAVSTDRALLVRQEPRGVQAPLCG